MDKCRETFERYQADLTGTNYEELKEHFDDCEKCYGTRYYIDSAYRAEWEVWKKAWQEQQKRIDELESQLADWKKKSIPMMLNGLCGCGANKYEWTGEQALKGGEV